MNARVFRLRPGTPKAPAPSSQSRPGPRRDVRMHLVRFEDMRGDGLFHIASAFDDYIGCNSIRIPRKSIREVNHFLHVIRTETPAAPAKAYYDGQCRRPITWFRAEATAILRAAESLVAILNRLGADLKRIETDRPPPILWKDEVQVVTRRPRRNGPKECIGIVQSRQIDRRKKLERFRRRAGRNLARRLKSGI